MKITAEVIGESFKTPFIEYKHFIAVTVIALMCELITEEFLSLPVGRWTLLIIAVNSMVTLILLGIMLGIVTRAVYRKEVEYFNIAENFMEGLKEYIVTMFWMILTFAGSLFIAVPTGVYSNILNIYNHISTSDFVDAALTVSQLSEDLPIDIQFDLAHSFQANILISVFVFMIFTSFAFLGKAILIESASIKDAMDLRNIFGSVRKIGHVRYLIFVILWGSVLIILFNVLWSLEFVLAGSLISSVLEAFFLFFSTSSFYLILKKSTNN